MMKDNVTDNIQYMLKKAWIIDKRLILLSLLQVPIAVLLPIVTTYLSKLVVELVTQGASIYSLVNHIVLLSSIILLVQLSSKYITTTVQWGSFGNRFRFLDIYMQNNMEIDYEYLENPDGQAANQKAQNALLGETDITQQIFTDCISILSNIIGLLSYTLILISFNPFVVLILLSVTLVSHIINKKYNKWHHKNKDNWINTDRKLFYIRWNAGDIKSAKDIKLYHMPKWFDQLFSKYFIERTSWWKANERFSFLIDTLIIILNLLRESIVYIILIFQAVAGNLTAADFIFYFGIISQYSGWLLGLINSYASLHKISLGIKDFRDFLDLHSRTNLKNMQTFSQEAPEIEFRNVSFKYPGSNSNTLSNISVKINKNERIAIVGLNGAGKSTFVKLLCGLYAPTSGEIFINGKNLCEYALSEYWSNISAVFQDIYLLPTSLEKNISLCPVEAIDYTKLNHALQLSGLYSKVQELPQREKTLVVKDIHSNAVELSGGEIQKLALARALYKNGSIMILDEPTAALDPISENELYRKYDQLIEDATSVFISHRLSSTRFCDQILFLENGKIVEQGTHNNLLEQNGKYAELFAIQSRYYREGVANEVE